MTMHYTVIILLILFRYSVGELNICTNEEDNTAPLHCFCPSPLVNTSNTANCWIFTELETNDSTWLAFQGQAMLQQLTLTVRPGGNLLDMPTIGLKYLQNLRHLHVKYAQINIIRPFAFANLTNLETIDLRRNQIVQLDAFAVSHLGNLLEITLDENRISELPRNVFYDLPNLEKLFLSQNNLSLLYDAAFEHLIQLKELELNFNYLTVFTRETFLGLSNLKRLDLSNNKLEVLADLTFAELWSLETLLLDSNQLKLISTRAFAGLNQLRKISLSDNRLKILNQGIFESVPVLRFLNLRKNQLESFNMEIIQPILENFYGDNCHLLLDQNNLTCDCRLKWIYNLHKTTINDQIKSNLEEITCFIDEDFYDYKEVQSSNENITEIDIENDQPQKMTKLNRKSGILNDPNVKEDKFENNILTKGDKVEVTQVRNSRHLFSIPVENLPCTTVNLISSTDTTVSESQDSLFLSYDKNSISSANLLIFYYWFLFIMAFHILF